MDWVEKTEQLVRAKVLRDNVNFQCIWKLSTFLITQINEAGGIAWIK